MATKRTTGEKAPQFQLARVGGGEFSSKSMLEFNWILSFQRYAT